MEPRRKLKKAKSSHDVPSVMKAAMQRQVAELRNNILSYRTLALRTNPNLDYSVVPNQANLMVFGPAGSGKSSLIRSFYRALHASEAIPKEVRTKVVVQGVDKNEGTTLFTSVLVKAEQPARMNHFTMKEEPGSSAIRAHDSRGQIWMDSREQAQLDLLIQGHVKDMSLVEQRNHRYAYLLWEFWKKDTELFPPEIIKTSATLADKPHCLLFVFDGSQEEIPNGEEEVRFYRDVLSSARHRNYFYPQVILTHIDKLHQSCSRAGDSERRFRDLCDLKVESVVMRLGVSRSCIHLIENYTAEHSVPDDRIDFHSLRLLHECMQQSDAYLQSQLKEKSSCAVF
jgi:energy-coupling factor transporter ATP-binding protein EcfA2